MRILPGNIINCYFIGIGGIGMSALAGYLNKNGYNVAGYDAVETELTRNLSVNGIKIHYNDDINEIPQDFKVQENTLVIYTPAIPSTHSELTFFRTNDFQILKRAELLGLMSKNLKTVGIAGTHGKTTVTALTAHILNSSELLNMAFVGGIVKNYSSNFIAGTEIDENWLVVEADEFDRSFLHLSPQISLITSVDADHLDIYGDKSELVNAFNDFVSQTKEIVVVNENVKLDFPEHLKVYTYGFGENADFRAVYVRTEQGKQIFDIVFPFGTYEDITISLPGKVNVENAVAAFAVSFLAGTKPLPVAEALETFKGVKRRFDVVFNDGSRVFVNDYAHHPVEIRRLSEAIKDFFPGMKTTAVFQPHLYSRTRDFADDFAKALDNFDAVLITDIYPAREQPIDGVSAKMIFDKIVNARKYFVKYDEIPGKLKELKPELLLTIGAGDIDNLVEPILKTVFENA